MIAIIDYGIGNLASITNALNKLNIASIITANSDEIRRSDGLILPGVGAAGEGMKNIRERKLDKILLETVRSGKLFLGICLGMQLLFEKSEEGNTRCLGILRGTVRRFKKERKIPQIGWNQILIQNTKLKIQNYNEKFQILFEKIPNESYFYFVNSYYCLPNDRSIIAAETEYGEKFASVIVKDNIVATQFHPEKSGEIGLCFIKNWLEHFNYSNN